MDRRAALLTRWIADCHDRIRRDLICRLHCRNFAGAVSSRFWLLDWGFVLLAGHILIELRVVKEPMMNLRLFSNPPS